MATAPPTTHQVVHGDSLWKISGEYYGHSSMAGCEKIFEANRDKLTDPAKLDPDESGALPLLTIPA